MEWLRKSPPFFFEKPQNEMMITHNKLQKFIPISYELDGHKIYMKVADLDEIYNFVVHTLFI
jgi:hypothetical protein